MKNNEKLKNDLSDFIDERLNEAYSLIYIKKDYKEKHKDCIEYEKNFTDKLSKELLENYYKLRDMQMNLDTMELQQAYKIGVKDIIAINKNEV